ncbi:MAG: hypothetical protein S4CHLAM123_08000 [Chlamydiales bacterium]|nr:hypothetical protein [Chlamydiales bacterium]
MLSMMTISYGNAVNNPHENAETSKVCKGHKLIEEIWGGDFQVAKRSKERWDEKTPYDRSIKSHDSEMYKEDNKWIIEYSWTHVDNYAKCDRFHIVENTQSNSEE